MSKLHSLCSDFTIVYDDFERVKAAKPYLPKSDFDLLTSRYSRTLDSLEKLIRRESEILVDKYEEMIRAANSIGDEGLCKLFRSRIAMIEEEVMFALSR